MAMYDTPQIRSLATPSKAMQEDPLIDPDTNPLDLSKDLHKGDCMAEQEKAINEAAGQS